MKERNLYENEFETLLKEKADQLKMYPSDKVWNQVYSSVHTNRRRFTAGMSILIGGILLLAGTVLFMPSRTVRTTADAVKTAPPAESENNLTSAFPSNGFSGTSTDLAGNRSSAKSAIATPTAPFVLAETGLQLNGPASATASTPQVVADNRMKLLPAADLLIAENTAGAELKAEKASQITISAEDLITTGLQPADLNRETAVKSSSMHNDRFSWEIYIAPTVNTHYLNGLDYQTMAQNIQGPPVMVVHIANVNGFVDNTPAIGYAVGGNILYQLSKNISLKAGLEFSFNRYYIKTYNTGRSTSAVLNSYLGYVADSLTNAVNPPSGGIKDPQRYQNRYYQVSMPVGVEMKVAGKGKLQLHLGANLQPSYLLNTDAYVLSKDYTSYVKDPEAFRRWNLNVGAEAFISYGSGKIRWELGPQVRYQIFSTYKNSYPLKENMLNYGLRIGITKTIR